jgi:hypothetical protein
LCIFREKKKESCHRILPSIVDEIFRVKYSSAILACLCGLLIYTAPLSAQELYLLGGALGRTASSDRTYTWSLEYTQALGEHTAISAAWLNEGHLPNHHRDGIMVQFWGRTRKINKQLVLAAGIGPYLWYDTELAESGFGYTDTHGVGGVFSLAGLWYTESPWVIQLRSNMIRTNSTDTYSAMVGLGYQLNHSQGHSPSSEIRTGERTTGNEITVFIGQTIANSYESQKSTAQGIEYRRRIARYLDWTIAWLNEGDNRLARRNGVLSQAWAVRAFFNDHLTLGVGFGPYLLIDKYRSIPNDEDTDVLAGMVTLSASYRFNPQWLVRLSWNRVTTNYNRDTDVIMIGPGYSF